MEKGLPEARLLTVEQVATMLSLSPRSIYNSCLKGSRYPFPIRPVRIRRCIRFRREDVESYIESL